MSVEFADRAAPDEEVGGGMMLFGLAAFPAVEGVSVREVLATLEPGLAAMAYLRSLAVEDLDADTRVAVMQAWEAQQGWVMAQSQTAVLHVAGASASDDDDWASEEIAAALHLSGRSAAQRVHIARLLHTRLPRLAAALEAGVISWRHVVVFVDECTNLPAATLPAVEARVIDRAGRQTPAEFTRAVRRAVIDCADVTAELDHAIAVQQRGVWLQAEPSGMASLLATLPAAHAEAVFAAIDAAARTTTGATDESGRLLGVDERRADALVAALVGADEGGAPRVLVEVQVVVDLPTLLGLADHPAQLGSYGPIPAGLARQLADDATWRRLITDPATGALGADPVVWTL